MSNCTIFLWNPAKRMDGWAGCVPRANDMAFLVSNDVTTVPVSVSHSLTVLSNDVVTKCSPFVPANSTVRMPLVWPRYVRMHFRLS